MVRGLIGGSDEADFGRGGKAGEAELVGEAVFVEGEFYGGNSEDMVRGFGGSGAKEASHAANCVILGNLEVSEVRLSDVCRPDGGAECEDGEDDGVVYFSPIVEVESTYRVAEEVEAPDGGSTTGRHGGRMHVPPKVVLEKNPQVSDRVRSSHGEDPAAREAQREGGYLFADAAGGGARGLKTDVLSFVHIYAKAIAGQPFRHGTEG